MGEEGSDGESAGKRGAGVVGGGREGVEEREGELEGLEEEAGRGGGEQVHPLGQLVEGAHQLHHHLTPGLFHRRGRRASSGTGQGEKESTSGGGDLGERWRKAAASGSSNVTRNFHHSRHDYESDCMYLDSTSPSLGGRG